VLARGQQTAGVVALFGGGELRPGRAGLVAVSEAASVSGAPSSFGTWAKPSPVVDAALGRAGPVIQERAAGSKAITPAPATTLCRTVRLLGS